MTRGTDTLKAEEGLPQAPMLKAGSRLSSVAGRLKRFSGLLILTIGFLIYSFGMKAQDIDDFQAEIKFEHTTVNLGVLTPDSAKQKFEFKFVNSGNAPLVLTYVHPSCSCIGLTYPRVPIAPGDTAAITGFLNPGAIHEPDFRRNILIRSNAASGQARVFIVGKLVKE